jgi:hypothetical protein
MSPAAPSSVDAIIDTGWNWGEIVSLAAAAGADVGYTEPGAQATRFAVARAVASGLCSGFGGGGWNDRNEYYFDGAGCGALGERIFLLSVAGVDPMLDATRAYREVERACRVGAAFAVRLRAGELPQELSIRCRGAFAPAPPEVRIRRALPLRSSQPFVTSVPTAGRTTAEN